MNKYYVDEQTLREVVEMVGKTAAAACISSFLGGVVLSTLVNPQPTKIVVENGVPANIYTVGGKSTERTMCRILLIVNSYPGCREFPARLIL